MSNSLPHNLTQQKLRQLLAAARLNRPHSDANADAPKYNWNQPRYFGRNQLEAIASLAQNVGSAFSLTLSSLGRSDCAAAAADTTQHFASDLLSEFSSQPQFHAAIAGDNNNACGFIAVSAVSACELIAKLLGDTEPRTQQQVLSGLENSLLQDIAAALINTLSRSLKQAGGPSLRQVTDVKQASPALDCPADRDLCRISFNVNTQSATAVFHVVLFASTLEPLVVKTKSAGAVMPQFQEIILNCIKPVPLSIRTRIASASLRLSDVLALEEGDIIVFDKSISEPIEILLNNKPAFQAHPAGHADKYALVIAEPSSQRIC